ncbi:hypothetical protein HRbin02_01255 [Candidatus Calditenuaceae archaeon HR02]|nr:hypothetical protein HRbin02_01255 [Candidatus Calditenuaceae archaeon HR02]
MSDKVLLEEAMRRRAVFNNLERYLEKIKRVVESLDKDGEVYLFGSVVEGGYTLSSDIDVLIVTEKDPFQVRAELWRAGITDPFELHIYTPEQAEQLKRRGRLRKI